MDYNKKNITFTGPKAILHILVGIAILFIASSICRVAYMFPIPYIIKPVLKCIFYVGSVYGLVILYCKKVVHITLTDCRITKLTIRPAWILCSILLPIGVSLGLMCMPGTFIVNGKEKAQIINIVVFALFGCGISAGIVEEVIFRGFIMRMFEARWGKAVAIFVPSVIFALLHLVGMNMNFQDILLLLIAGTSAGVMFSLIVYQSGSIWNSALVHGIWNIIVIGKILTISTTHNNDAIFNYELLTKSTFLTGGLFGIESSIIAVIGYCIVILLTILLLRKNLNNNI